MNSIVLADPNRTNGPAIGVLGGVGAARDTAKVADYGVPSYEDTDLGISNGVTRVIGSPLYTADQLIVPGRALIVGYIVHVAVATAGVTIEDSITAGGTVKITIPSGKAIGEYFFGGMGIECSNGIFLNYAASATGTISVVYLA